MAHPRPRTVKSPRQANLAVVDRDRLPLGLDAAAELLHHLQPARQIQHPARDLLRAGLCGSRHFLAALAVVGVAVARHLLQRQGRLVQAICPVPAQPPNRATQQLRHPDKIASEVVLVLGHDLLDLSGDQPTRFRFVLVRPLPTAGDSGRSQRHMGHLRQVADFVVLKGLLIRPNLL